jgi:hypothetical protein
MQYAGGLWRDEAAALATATTSFLSGLWERLGFEIMPALFPLVLRAWTFFDGWGTDTGLRFLGLLVGISIVSAIWLNGFLFKFRIPFVSIILLGFSPVVITWGNTIRPYGLGIFLFLITVGMLWKAATSPKSFWIVASTLFGILSVQCTYSNSLLLFGAYMGAMAITVYFRTWTRLFMLAGMGLLTVATLLPYLDRIKKIREWAIVVQVPVSIGHILTRLSEALSSPTPLMLAVWIGLCLLAAGLTFLKHRHDDLLGAPQPNEKAKILFSWVALLGSTIAYLIWLYECHYITYAWHYIPLIAAASLYLEIILSSYVRSSRIRIFRLICFLSITTALAFPTWRQLHIGHTNINFVATIINKKATPDDLIVVNPWHVSISFQRYYNGSTNVMCIPPLNIIDSTRYDLFKKQMTLEEPLKPLFSQIKNTLKKGNKVWLVGGVHLLKTGQNIPFLPPAPKSGTWNNAIYSVIWSMQTGYYIQTHAKSIEVIQTTPSVPIYPYENLSLMLVNGWRADE